MIIKELHYGSELYESSKHFREEVLRRPLGLLLSMQDIADEHQQIHIAAIIGFHQIKYTEVIKLIRNVGIYVNQAALQGYFVSSLPARNFIAA